MSAARSKRANDKHKHLQRTPILVMGCSLLIACCIAFGGTNWTASAQPSEDQLPEQNTIVEPGYYQETIGSYEAISQSDDNERAENLRLAAEAINGYVIEPGATFSFNEVVGPTRPLLICARLKTARAMLLQLLLQARQQPKLHRLHNLLHLSLMQTAFLTKMLCCSTSSSAKR